LGYRRCYGLVLRWRRRCCGKKESRKGRKYETRVQHGETSGRVCFQTTKEMRALWEEKRDKMTRLVSP
jgi:hypothetical protein